MTCEVNFESDFADSIFYLLSSLFSLGLQTTHIIHNDPMSAAAWNMGMKLILVHCLCWKRSGIACSD